MDRSELKAKIREAFQKVLEHNNFDLTENTSAQDVEGWESITHMMIITEIEEVFQVKFKLMDLMNMDNVGDLINALEKELKDKVSK